MSTNIEEKEIWKINPNFPLQEISSFGKIKNIKSGMPFTSVDNESFKKSKSYIKVRLTLPKNFNNKDINKYKNGNEIKNDEKEDKNQDRPQIYLHRLVAFTFIDNPDPINKNTINHKDGNIYNNKVSNLEWMSSKEQSEHSVKNNLKSSTSRGRPVKIYKSFKEYKIYKSLSDAYKDINPILKEQISDSQFRKLFTDKKNFESNDGCSITGEYDDIYEPQIIDGEIEKWKPIIIDGEKDPYKGFEVSNFGRISYFDKIKQRIINNITKKRNYMIVNIYNNVRKKSLERQVHRIVAEAFCDIPEHLSEYTCKKLTVDHINSIPTDNHYKNLKWCTQKEQAQNINSKLKRGCKPVNKYEKNENGDIKLVKKYNSVSEASRDENCHYSTLFEKIDKNEEWRGFIWKFENQIHTEEKKKKDNKKTPVRNGIKIAKCKMIDDKFKIIKEYKTISEASKEHKYHKSTLSKKVKNNDYYDGFYWVKLPIDKDKLYVSKKSKDEKKNEKQSKKDENKLEEKDEKKSKEQNETYEKKLEEKDKKKSKEQNEKKCGEKIKIDNTNENKTIMVSTDEQKFKTIVVKLSEDKKPLAYFDSFEEASYSLGVKCKPSRIKISIRDGHKCLGFYWGTEQVKC